MTCCLAQKLGAREAWSVLEGVLGDATGREGIKRYLQTASVGTRSFSVLHPVLCIQQCARALRRIRSLILALLWAYAAFFGPAECAWAALCACAWRGVCARATFSPRAPPSCSSPTGRTGISLFVAIKEVSGIDLRYFAMEGEGAPSLPHAHARSTAHARAAGPKNAA